MNFGAEQIAFLRLARTETIGPVTFHRLLSRYKSAENALEALPTLTRNKRLLSIATADAVLAECEALAKLGGRIVLCTDADYPVSLAATEDAPPALSVIGNTELFRKASVGIVGARNASLNGRKFAWKLAQDLGRTDYVITSGLARGIDTAAHEGALDCGTIAVVAGGVDVVYPKENEALYQKICENGLVVSECPLSTQPIAQHFPKRNRIISGLSVGVVVVEANLKSGSLITARMAGEQGRDVMAVPGFPGDARSEGPNALIRDGAILVRGAADVVEHLSSFIRGHDSATHCTAEPLLFEPPASDFASEADMPERILREISHTPSEIDEIVRSCNLSSAVVQGCLLEMELSGLVRRLPGNKVCLLNVA